MTNWLTPETAIGARLPCGATVERAEWLDRDKEFVTVFFDRAPAINMDGNSRPEMREFYLDGRHRFNKLPNLIPPTPAQPGVFVTREGLLAAVREAIGDAPHTANDIADALGIPPDPPKIAPWEVAYEARYAVAGVASPDPRTTWKAAVEWHLGVVMEHLAGAEGGIELARIIRRRIMGDQA